MPTKLTALEKQADESFEGCDVLAQGLRGLAIPRDAGEH